MRVKVIDREAMKREWESPGLFRVITREVVINDNCPVCNEPRGLPVRRSFYEGGNSYSVDCWVNSCGHIDMYDDVLREATQ